VTSKSEGPTALEVLERLWGLDHGLDSASKRMLRDIGVSGPQRVVLRLLTLEGGMGPGELARRMHHHPATISSLLNRLEVAGYVERRHSTEDRRRSTVLVTRRGRALGQRTAGTIEEQIETVLRDLDPAQVDSCLAVLDTLVEALAPVDEA
jgi:MarR family transcriptional regulator, organic hydroperoxide resistance regulator